MGEGKNGDDLYDGVDKCSEGSIGGRNGFPEGCIMPLVGRVVAGGDVLLLLLLLEGPFIFPKMTYFGRIWLS